MWKQTEVTIVAKNSATTTHHPSLSSACSSKGSGFFLGNAKCISVAGTSQFATHGRNSLRNSLVSTLPSCHTISVVMSPNGENAPPALAATTMLVHAAPMNSGLPRPTATTTAPISNAVVRLSAIGEMQNARPPVAQKMARNPKPRDTSQALSHKNTLCLLMAEM